MNEDKSGYEIALERIFTVRESMGTDKEIFELDLWNLGIDKIPIEINDLTNLSRLNLDSNRISKIENLDRLTNLKVLRLAYNQISKIENLDKLINLTELYLFKNQISKIENLQNLKNLKTLWLYRNQISKIENLQNLKNLKTLWLYRNQISKIENLQNLIKLTELNLFDNQISKIENLQNLTNLRILFLSNNQISKIENLDNLTNLTQINLGFNQISKIENLQNLTNLRILYLGYNQISNIFQIPEVLIYTFKKRAFELRIGKNPFIGKDGISKEDYPMSAIHTKQFIHDYYKFKAVTSFQKYQLPFKIMLFGNSNVGKSDFSDFLRIGKLVNPSKAGTSTDILEIKTWKVKVKDKDDWIATIFDFGGQDFYHATYQMFYTTDCIYCVLFEDASNMNEVAPHLESRLEAYQNYNVAYWLANVKYHLEKERQNEIKHNKNENKETATYNSSLDAIYLIRNKIDLASDSNSQSQVLATMQQYQIFHRFDISLNIHEKQKYQSYRNILIENIQIDIHKGRSIEMIESDIRLL
ncbi:MAG: leucine-rich repeat domain-containing protein, partial [Saprospiraceae bacterium]